MKAELSDSADSIKTLSSLKTRLIISTLLLTLIFLPLVGVGLNDAFRTQMETATENELSAYVYSILAVAEVEERQLEMPEMLLEDRFNLIQSGLYALIMLDDNSAESDAKRGELESTLGWQSNSLLGLDIPSTLPRPEPGGHRFSSHFFDQRDHLIYSFSAVFEQPDGDFPLTLHIIKDQRDMQRQIEVFRQELWTWLLLLMGFLALVQLSWLIWILRPLKSFEVELAAIQGGTATQLSGSYPAELQSVSLQLNQLLATERNQRKRYRNALSDLAHSLKTPLAVIQSQADLNKSSQEQISTIDNIISHQLSRAQSAAGSAWHLGTKVSPVVEKLRRSLAKIYADKALSISVTIDDRAVFKGDEMDLTELLGNLLDNACKAAKANVMLRVLSDDKKLEIMVEDDGDGIAQSQADQLMQRGVRTDSYDQGHGVGLAIVSDLVDSYGGAVVIGQSEKLGGARFSLSFKQS
ncbi:ATP-binding protein [bacterium]|nr:ATP-binding protein [bacterium]